VILDKAYSHPSARQAMRERGIRMICPERDTRPPHRTAKGSRGGRPPTFDPERYKQRNVVERCFNRLEQFRDLATRYANAPPTTKPASPSPPSSSGSDDLQDSH
jgi:transposase